MNPGRFFERVAGVAVRWPWLVILPIGALTGAGIFAATRLDTNAGTDTLVSKGSSEFKATQDFHEKFGDEPVIVLVKEDLRRLVLTKDLEPLFELEECFAGGTQLAEALPKKKQQPLPPVCDRIAQLRPSHSVFGPATFLYLSVAGIQQALQGQIGGASQQARVAAAQAERAAAKRGASAAEQQQAAEAAAQQVLSQFQSSLIQVALQYGITSVPRLDDPNFVSRVVFDESKPAETPKERFGYLFPNRNAAQIIVRLRPDMTDAERHEAIGLFKQAVGDPRFKLSDGSYVVTGAPVVVDAGARELRNQTLLLLGVAGLVMALTLLLILPRPLRLLPLGVAISAGALTLGLVALFGGSLTVGAIAMLPVLVGLAVDYAIQFQARFNESRAEGAAPGRAVADAAAGGGPVIGAACLATIAGFAVFVLAPSPLVRSFGLLLVIGIALAFVIALTGGLAALGLSAWRGSASAVREPPAARHPAGANARLQKTGVAAIALALATPRRVLAAGLLLAVCGWVASAGTGVETDIRDLAPSNLKALNDLNELEKETGISGDVNVTIRANDPTDPAVISWAEDFQQRVLQRHGFSGAAPSCADAQICPALSLTDFFGGASSSGSSTTTSTQSAGDVHALVQALPCFISQIVISHRGECSSSGGTPIGDTADVAFGIRVQPLTDQQDLINDIRAQIDPPGGPSPPPGTTVELAGLPVLAAEANTDLSNSRWWLPLAGLLAVGIVLVAIYRSLRRAIVPLIPVLMATGWSGLVVAALGVALNPMSATLGALVIAIATEFSVILSARYVTERRDGLSVGESLRRTYLRTGAAVLASGVTAIAGFAVLAIAGLPLLDDIGLISVAPVLRDFGLVTVVDLLVALAGVLLVLPAAVVWSEEGFRLPSRARPEPLVAGESAP
ncbi:MAG TPA: MMPL family transporter [Solirubrobacterales bacterium]|nr:MMPL family transporter [Solirubrobacterales bacterium]